jgi:hypothetical protein
LWSASFPRARAANISNRKDLIDDDVQRHFKRVRQLSIAKCHQVKCAITDHNVSYERVNGTGEK